MSYVTVFEITHQAFPWFLIVFNLVVVLLGTVLFLLTRNLGPITMVFRFLMLLFFCLCAVLDAYNVHERRHYLQAYENGKYAVVEGPVEDYSWRGRSECFSVRSVRFCRGTGNELDWPIGVTHDGVPVRVAYLHERIPLEASSFPKILRLELGHNSLPANK